MLACFIHQNAAVTETNRSTGPILFASGKTRVVHFDVVHHVADVFHTMKKPRIVLRACDTTAAC
jgi:hypothetical protein